MRDEPDPFAPIVELAAGRLEGETEPRLGAEVEDDLMRRARSRPGNRTGKPAFDRSMEVAAKDSLHLGVASNDLGKGRAAAEPGLVHPADSGQKRRMMHQHQSGPLRRSR